jgi:diaminopimelate decarboxylase
MIVEDSGRKVVGIHAHIGSGVDSPAPLLEAAMRLLDVSTDFWNLRHINFGGGIAVPYRPGEAEFPIAEYGQKLAAVAGGTLRGRNVTAIVEPGRYLTAQAGLLLARATTKRISAGTEWVGVDSGFNHLARPSKYDAYHHILNASRGSDASLRESWEESATREEMVVAGNICESSDVFTRERGAPSVRRIDPVRVGDLLAFCDAGAYGFSMASHYNARLLPAEVLVDGGEARIIRRRQRNSDLLRGFEDA